VYVPSIIIIKVELNDVVKILQGNLKEIISSSCFGGTRTKRLMPHKELANH